MSAIRFSFLIPTRGNPSGLVKLFRSIQETTDALGELEVVLAIDEDDEQSCSIEAPGVQVKRVILPPGQTMGALNHACYAASQGRFVMVMNDDVILRTPGWDRLVAEALSGFRDDIALIHVNDLLFRERLCTFPMVSRRACDAVGLCPGTYRRYKIDDHIYDVYSLLAVLGHRRIVYLPDVVFEHENHIPAHAAGTGHAHAFTSVEGKVYVPKKEIIELDDRVFLEGVAERKAAALRLATLVEADRQARVLGVREAAHCRRLDAVRDPYAHRSPSNVRTQSATHRPSSATSRVTVAVVTSDVRNDHARQCIARIKAHALNYDLVVVDNAGSQGFNHPRVMNQVLRNAETDYVALMDDDVLVEPGWLDGLLGCMDPTTGVVAPLHTDREGKLSFSGLYLAGDGRGTHEHTLDRPTQPRIMQAYCSAILLIDMGKCGHILMDERYSKYFFDLVHGFEVWEAGYKIVCTPEVSVTHLGGATMNWGSAESNERLTQDRATFIDQWVETGRLRRLEEGIWQQHPYVRNLCEIPHRIERLFCGWENQDRQAFQRDLATLTADCGGHRLFEALLHKQMRQTVPAMYARGASDLAEECVNLGILSTAYGAERECLLELSQRLLGAGQSLQAASLMKRALERIPGDPELLRELGLAQMAIGDLREALRLFLSVVERCPGDVEALASLGTVAKRFGRASEARGCFMAALAQIERLGPAGAAYGGLAAKLISALSDGLQSEEEPAGLGCATDGIHHPRVSTDDVPVDGVTGRSAERICGGDGVVVSAIVSTYNAERFIRGCLEDLEAQTIRDRLEIIMIDSGSEQGERGIVEEFRRRFDNIRYVRTERENHHAALNRGIEMARGKYVTMANTDDRHRPDAFERMVAVLEARPDAGLVYADSTITDQENATSGSAQILGRLRLPEFDRRLLFRGCFVGPQPMWRKELHERYGYFDPEFEICGDYEFWLRVGIRETFVHIPEILGLYFLSPTSNERVNRIRRHQETERARRKYWPAEWGEMPPWDADYNIMLASSTSGEPAAAESRASRETVGVLSPASVPDEESDMNAGHLALEQQAWPQVCTAFIRVLERDKNCAPARSGLGLGLTALGDAEEGLAQLQEAVRLEPNPDHVCNLASGLIHVGRDVEAERLLRGILEVVPGHEAAAILGALTTARGDTSRAQALAASRPTGREEIARRLETAAGHMAAKRWAEAAEGFRRVLAAAPDLAEARAALGSALLVLGRTAEAIPELRQAAERLNTSEAWSNLGWAQAVGGHPHDARASLVKAIELEPANLEPQRNLAALFETLKMPREAEAAYDLILLTSPGDPEAVKGKARCAECVAKAGRSTSQRPGEMVLIHG